MFKSTLLKLGDMKSFTGFIKTCVHISATDKEDCNFKIRNLGLTWWHSG